jgi:hypothetical protein
MRYGDTRSRIAQGPGNGRQRYDAIPSRTHMTRRDRAKPRHAGKGVAAIHGNGRMMETHTVCRLTAGILP